MVRVTSMRIGFVQFKPSLLDVDGNVDAAFRLIGRKRADLLVLPELFNTGYNFRIRREVKSVAELIPSGSTTRLLRDFSKRDGAMIVAGLVERKGTSYYNSAVVVRDGKYLGTYRKVHLFFNEKKFFKPGLEFKVFGNVGVMICFDWYFPESARTLMLKGAQVIAHPSNLVLPHCPESMKIRALENKVYTVTADRVGIERGLRFIGQSEIISPTGRVLYRASARGEECAVRDVNLATARDKAVTPMNNLVRDITPAAYLL
jgi:beta-ureidopropionase